MTDRQSDTDTELPARPRVVVIGEVLAAFLADPGLPLEHATRFTRTFAGAETNVAVALARCSVRTAVIGRVGDDALGVAARRSLRGEGIDVSGLVSTPGRSTGVLVRSVSGHLATDVVYARGGSAGAQLVAADLRPDLIAGADVLHFSGITPMLSSDADDACRTAVAIARDHGTAVSFDPNIRLRLAPIGAWRERIASYLREADLLLAGADELDALEPGWADAGSVRMAGDREQVLVVKRGADGATAWAQGRRYEQPAFPAHQVDPVGAGDAFDAGYLSGWLAGLTPPRALRRAAAFGAATVSVVGDSTGITERTLPVDLDADEVVAAGQSGTVNR